MIRMRIRKTLERVAQGFFIYYNNDDDYDKMVLQLTPNGATTQPQFLYKTAIFI